MSQTQQAQTQQDQQQDQQMPTTVDEQSLYDQSFLQQITQGHGAPAYQTVDWAREYFDNVEAQVRSARRVAEVAALGQMEQRIAAKTAMIVLQLLRTNPTLREQITGGGQGASKR